MCQSISILIGQFTSRDNPLAKNDLFSPLSLQAGYEVTGLHSYILPQKTRTFEFFGSKNGKNVFLANVSVCSDGLPGSD